MKRCPQCNRIENDTALAFCRVDGAPLITGPLADSENTTAIFDSTAPSSESTTRNFSPKLTKASAAQPVRQLRSRASTYLRKLARLRNLHTRNYCWPLAAQSSSRWH